MIREYRTSVTLIIDDTVRDNEIDFSVLNELQEYGLTIDRIDHTIGVIEGVIRSDLVHGLKHIKYVSYVREMGSYLCVLNDKSSGSSNAA